MQFFDELSIGDRTEIGRHTFTAEEIVRFATAFDPQPFHVDAAAAARSHFGALCASGWHTAALWMRLAVDFFDAQDAEVRARGGTPARMGPSPGFRDLRWLKPVYVGDTVTYATEVMEKRPSGSRPEWGLAVFRNTGTNQHGDLVLSFLSTAFVERRASEHSRSARPTSAAPDRSEVSAR